MKAKLLWYFLPVLLAPLQLQAQQHAADTVSDRWKFSAWAEMFVLPGEPDIFNPTFYARKKNLHLEARYNYEDVRTGSLWVGRRFTFGNKLKLVLVPMAGVVMGNTNGMAPGLEVEVMYGKFDLYSESEHVFDFSEKENNFFYQYGELAIRPVQPLRTGAIVQRTRLFESDRDVQRGVFAEYYWKRFRVGAFYFSPFADDQFWIASLSVDF